MLLLKNFSPHLLRAGWCRGIWKCSLCLLLAPLPCMQLQSDTMSCCHHFGMILWGKKRVNHLFWKWHILFLCSISQVPALYGGKHSRMDLTVTIMKSQIIVTNKLSWHSCSYSIDNCCCTACYRTPVELADLNHDLIISQIQYTVIAQPSAKKMIDWVVAIWKLGKRTN